MSNWQDKDFYFGEADFEDRMRDQVEPWLESSVEEGYIISVDSTRLHYHMALNPKEQAAIVISHGFCEFFGKYHEVAYYFYQAGYSVFFLEHRGHGFSDRMTETIDQVHFDTYDACVEDFHQFINQVVKRKSTSGRLILFAHSMGGCIGSLYLEQHPDTFERAVLSSPMHAVNVGDNPKWVVNTLMGVSDVLRWDKKYGPGQGGWQGKYDFDHSSTMSRPRYEYVFDQRNEVEEYSTWGGTYGWIKASIKATYQCRQEAGKITIPVLLCQAGADTMVDNRGQNIFARNCKTCKKIRFRDSKHEIFNARPEIREKYYKIVFEFMEKARR